jgi:hypothetical protein
MKTGLIAAALLLCVTAPAIGQPMRLAGTSCEKPPVLHCPDANCAGDVVTNGGPAVETKTGRNYFLDYPCDLKKAKRSPSFSRCTARLVWQLAASLLPAARLQRQVPAGDRHSVFAAPRLGRGRRRVSAEHRHRGGRGNWFEEYQVVLVGRPLTGRHDVEPNRPNRLFQSQG